MICGLAFCRLTGWFTYGWVVSTTIVALLPPGWSGPVFLVASRYWKVRAPVLRPGIQATDVGDWIDAAGAAVGRSMPPTLPSVTT